MRTKTPRTKRRRKHKRRTTAPASKHMGLRIAGDVAAIIDDIAAHTGWAQRQVVEEYMRAAEAARRGETAAGKALGELLNAARASHAAAQRAEALAKVAKSTVRAASARMRALTKRPTPATPQRQSA